MANTDTDELVQVTTVRGFGQLQGGRMPKGVAHTDTDNIVQVRVLKGLVGCMVE